MSLAAVGRGQTSSAPFSLLSVLLAVLLVALDPFAVTAGAAGAQSVAPAVAVVPAAAPQVASGSGCADCKGNLIGGGGNGLGFNGLRGAFVGLDTYYNPGDPGDRFVGVAQDATGAGFTWAASKAGLGSLYGTHRFVVTTVGGTVSVTMDGTKILESAAALPERVLVGFTGATGMSADAHSVSNVSITATRATGGAVTVPDAAAGRWVSYGTASQSNGALSLTSSVTSQSGSVFWPVPVKGSGITATFDTTITQGSGGDGLTFALLSAVGGAFGPRDLRGGTNPSSPNCDCSYGDPIATSTGALTDSVIDLAVPALGADLGWARTYDSTDAATAGPLGYGWTASSTPSLHAVEDAGYVPANVLGGGGSGQGFAGLTGHAVSLDTYPSPQDPARNFIGIATGGTASGLTYLATNTSIPNLHNTHRYTVTATNGTLIVTMDGTQVLSQALTLPPEVLLGFTAATGGLADEHLISNVTVTHAGNGATVSDPSTGGWAMYGSARMVGSAVQLTNQTTDKTGSSFWPAALPSAGLTVEFDATINYGGGADGLTLALLDAAQYPFHRLDRANKVTLVQENGSEVTFTRQADGTYAAAPRVHATLTFDATGAATFVRDRTQTFRFDTAGRLVQTEDENANAQTYERDATGKVSAIRAAGGRALTFAYDTTGRVASVTSGLGRAVTYTYDSAGDLVTVQGPDGGTWTYGYDTGHRLVAITDPRGSTTTTTYDTHGRAVEQTDPAGGVLTFAYAGDIAGSWTATVTQPDGSLLVEEYDQHQLITRTTAAGTPDAATWRYNYDPLTNKQIQVVNPDGTITTTTGDAAGRTVAATDNAGRVTYFTYTAAGKPASVTTPTGKVTRLEYDTRGNLTRTTLPGGQQTGATYDAKGQLLTQTDATGATTSYGYDTAGDAVSVTGPDGQVLTSRFNADGMLVAVTDPLGNLTGADPADHTTTYAYDQAGRVTEMVDPLGHTTTTTYDAAGAVTSLTDANGHTRTFTYTSTGKVHSATTADGLLTTYGYDDLGRQTTTTTAGRTNEVAYDPHGNVTATTDPAGAVASRTYDITGRLTSSTTPGGRVTAYTYDAAGQVASVTAPGGRTTSYTYDADGHQTRIDAPGTSADVEYTYDANGRTAAITTSTGVTTYTYDNVGRVLQARRADGSIVAWAYNSSGQTTRYTDAAGAVTQNAYDSVGQQTASTDTAGRTTQYEYDAAGRLAALIQPGAAITRYTYDAVGQRTGTDYTDSTPDVATTYDAAGRPTTVTDGTGTTTYAYDPLGQVTQVTNGAGAAIGYAWDLAGHLTDLTYPTGDTVTYDYDPDGALTSVTDWAARTFTYEWSTAGEVDTLTYPNGVVTEYDHDDTGKTLAVTTTSDGVDLLELAYAYNPAGLLADQTTTRSTQSRAPPAQATTTSTYTWDVLARVTQVTGTGAGTLTFDPAGSVTTLADGRTLTYDTGRQLTALTTPAGATNSAATTAFAYDLRGNRTTATTGAGAGVKTTAHTYDSANQLTTVTNPDGTSTSYTYAATGLRATAATGSTIEQYTWNTLAAVPTLLTDATRAYVYGLGSTPLAQVSLTDGDTDYLHTDTLGSVRTTTNATGEVTADADYDAYGTPRDVTTEPVRAVTRFGYAGEYTDTTGYVYLRARYYDPTTAQFLTRDPVEATTGNPYGYTDGNPLQYTDPLGLDWLDFENIAEQLPPHTNPNATPPEAANLATSFSWDDTNGENAVVNFGQSYGAGTVDWATGAVNAAVYAVTFNESDLSLIPAIGDPNAKCGPGYEWAYYGGLVANPVAVFGLKGLGKRAPAPTVRAPASWNAKTVLPSGATVGEVGRPIWGNGIPSPTRLDGLTDAQLRALASLEDAQMLNAMYRGAESAIRSNPTAPVRVALSQKIIDAWRRNSGR